MALLVTDPVDIALDDTGDIDLADDGGPYLTTGLLGVAQLCRTALLLIRGEWFQDLDAGVPWLENANVPANLAILGQHYDEAAVRSAVRDAILAVPGVLSLKTFELALDALTRTLSITWSARTVFGDTAVDTLAPLES